MRINDGGSSTGGPRPSLASCRIIVRFNEDVPGIAPRPNKWAIVAVVQPRLLLAPSFRILSLRTRDATNSDAVERTPTFGKMVSTLRETLTLWSRFNDVYTHLILSFAHIACITFLDSIDLASGLSKDAVNRIRTRYWFPECPRSMHMGHDSPHVTRTKSTKTPSRFDRGSL
jgi:hypothetical protein